MFYTFGFPQDSVVASTNITEAETALSQLTDNSTFRLLVLDIDLRSFPDGITFLRDLRTTPSPVQDLPVLIVTGGSIEDKVDILEELGDIEVLQKPFGYDEFKRTLTTIVEKYSDTPKE
jgi:DNA-binding response OmpR family regulator